MSLSGKIEDVSIADVLQFIHLGERSGTLAIVGPTGARAEIAFHRGRIINAQGPATPRIGDLLLAEHVVDEAAIARALEEQRTQPDPLPMGRLLVQIGAARPEDVRRAVERQVEAVLFDVFTWTRGAFDFVLNEIRPSDDLALAPGDVIPDFHVNTQMILLEAARIFDERRRGEAAAPREATTTVTAPPSVEPRGRAPQRIQLLSHDNALVAELQRRLGERGMVGVRVMLRDAGLNLPKEAAPIVLVDRRSGGVSRAELATLRRARPRATLVAIAPQGEPLSALYHEGVTAPVDADPETIVACLSLITQQRRQLASDELVAEGLRAGFARLRRALGEFRSGLISATVSLNLMNIISESAERAVLLLVRRNDLLVLGAFGDAMNGAPLAACTRGMHIERTEAGALLEGLRDGRPRRLDAAQAKLPPPLRALLGVPASGECAVFPILGGQSVIATIYADNGRRAGSIDELEFLELATAQVGIAYENELLRRQATQRRAYVTQESAAGR